ncbi:TPA: restriction endonuclease subunit S [Clostridioides difficile]|nr:restriction endonuclease subunit S [Clostridioides difficile]HBF0593331.1 restriction endonuclease subunit S [Clostridioides difficile]HBH3608418.1 restriction endonuclease subunit S [Clostridioides difficile]HBY2673845.1 restriction endonuclease subunit S [Clostridioides difficile]HBY3426198.1 restriction endonuclease subunit S [Clostridioides difficile]
MKITKLKDIARIVSGSTAPKENLFNRQVGLPFIRAGNLESLCNGYNLNKLPKIDKNNPDIKKQVRVPKDTIIFAKSGMSCMKDRVYRTTEDAYIVSHLAGVICNEDIIPSYLKYYFNIYKPSRLVVDESYPSIRLSDISNIEISLPNLKIQEKIANTLDKAQELINKRKEQIEALDELVKSRFIEMFGDPINNTKKFDMKKIKEISIYLKRGVSPKYVEQSNIKVINQKCIYWRNLKVENCKYYDENLKEKIEDIFLKQNDILINSTGTGTLGRCVKFNKIDNSEYIADSHVTVLRSISNNLNSDYFAALFEFTNIQDTIYRKCVNGSTNQIELSVSKLGEYLIMVPPIEFQNQFSEFVKQVDKLKLKIETNLKELEDNFNSLMQKAFKGELFN